MNGTTNKTATATRPPAGKLPYSEGVYGALYQCPDGQEWVPIASISPLREGAESHRLPECLGPHYKRLRVVYMLLEEIRPA